jgi:hypothetical protein
MTDQLAVAASKLLAVVRGASEDAPIDVRLTQAGLHWIVDPEWRRLRDEIDAAVEQAILRGAVARFRRVVLYDAPAAHVAAFLEPSLLTAEGAAQLALPDRELHERVAAELIQWQAHISMWLVLIARQRDLAFDRVSEIYEAKMWVFGPVVGRSLEQQRLALPADLLFAGSAEAGEVRAFDEQFDRSWRAAEHESLIWLNSDIEVLVGNCGDDAAGHIGRSSTTFGHDAWLGTHE